MSNQKEAAGLNQLKNHILDSDMEDRYVTDSIHDLVNDVRWYCTAENEHEARLKQSEAAIDLEKTPDMASSKTRGKARENLTNMLNEAGKLEKAYRKDNIKGIEATLSTIDFFARNVRIENGRYMGFKLLDFPNEDLVEIYRSQEREISTAIKNLENIANSEKDQGKRDPILKAVKELDSFRYQVDRAIAEPDPFFRELKSVASGLSEKEVEKVTPKTLIDSIKGSKSQVGERYLAAAKKLAFHAIKKGHNVRAKVFADFYLDNKNESIQDPYTNGLKEWSFKENQRIPIRSLTIEALQSMDNHSLNTVYHNFRAINSIIDNGGLHPEVEEMSIRVLSELNSEALKRCAENIENEPGKAYDFYRLSNKMADEAGLNRSEFNFEDVARDILRSGEKYSGANYKVITKKETDYLNFFDAIMKDYALPGELILEREKLGNFTALKTAALTHKPKKANEIYRVCKDLLDFGEPFYSMSKIKHLRQYSKNGHRDNFHPAESKLKIQNHDLRSRITAQKHYMGAR